MQVRPRRQSDIDPLVAMVELVTRLDGYPPRGPMKAPEDLAVVARALVSPMARRIGAGRALIATAVEGAHTRGQQPVLEVAVHFDAAIGLYESSGWDRVGAVTMQLGEEPTLQRFVSVGPTPAQDSAAASVTRR